VCAFETDQNLLLVLKTKRHRLTSSNAASPTSRQRHPKNGKHRAKHGQCQVVVEEGYSKVDAEELDRARPGEVERTTFHRPRDCAAPDEVVVMGC
jgi:hypothetical protein